MRIIVFLLCGDVCVGAAVWQVWGVRWMDDTAPLVFSWLRLGIELFSLRFFFIIRIVLIY